VLFDPETGQWTAAPPMPEPRAGGAAVTLGDGAVLLVGGYTHTMPRNESCSWGATGLTSAVLFIPGS
jgi:N-acetylneuraminic acid mutarotase